MKKLGIGLLVVASILATAFYAHNFYREAIFVEEAAIGLSRFSLTRVLEKEECARLCFESRSVRGFALPADYSGLSVCGTQGYGTIREIEHPETSVDRQPGCTRKHSTKDGTYYHFIITEKTLIVIQRSSS